MSHKNKAQTTGFFNVAKNNEKIFRVKNSNTM